MSRIIKGSDLIINEEPKLIQSVFTEIFSKESLKEQNLNKSDKSEESQYQDFKNESKLILAETENMVMELLEKAREESRIIMEDAQEEIDIKRTELLEEAKQIRQDSLAQGYQDGIKQAQQAIEADRQLAIEQSQQIREEARLHKLAIIKSSERDMMRLILAIAKKVINTEIKINTQIIVNIVREAISYLDTPENINVYINPQDLEKVLEAIKEQSLKEIGSKDLNIQVHEDIRIEAGGCLIESESGNIDARLENRIEIIENAILEVGSNE